MKMENGRMYGDIGSTSQNSDMNYWNREQSTIPQIDYQILWSLNPLGLKLTETPSLLDKVDQLIQEQSEEYGNYYNATVTASSRPKDGSAPTNKMKAENFPFKLLRIGTWQWVTVNEGDLVAKCYFAKRKLVWELLEKGLKKKIEILWADILSFQASYRDERIGVLEIELKQPPTFHLEREPLPRKHTQWKIVHDFTNGRQATRCRIHHLEFSPGALERCLDKLLICDEHWRQLNGRCFPSLESPYFPTEHEFSLEFSGHGSSYVGSNIFQQQHFSFPNVHEVAGNSLITHYPTNEHTPQQSITLKDSDSPISDELISNQAPLLWGQGMSNVVDSTLNSVGGVGFAGFAAAPPAQVNTNPVGRIGFSGFAAAAAASAQANSAFPLQSHNHHLGGIISTPSNSQLQMQMQMPLQMQEQLGLEALQEPATYLQQPRYDQKAVSDLQNIGLCNLQIENDNGVAEGNLYREGNSTSGNIDLVTDFNLGVIDNSMAMNNDNYLASNGGSTIYPPPLDETWQQLQASMDVLPVNQSPAFSDPNTEYSAQAFNDINKWRKKPATQ